MVAPPAGLREIELGRGNLLLEPEVDLKKD